MPASIHRAAPLSRWRRGGPSCCMESRRRERWMAVRTPRPLPSRDGSGRGRRASQPPYSRRLGIFNNRGVKSTDFNYIRRRGGFQMHARRRDKEPCHHVEQPTHQPEMKTGKRKKKPYAAPSVGVVGITCAVVAASSVRLKAPTGDDDYQLEDGVWGDLWTNQ